MGFDMGSLGSLVYREIEKTHPNHTCKISLYLFKTRMLASSFRSASYKVGFFERILAEMVLP